MPFEFNEEFLNAFLKLNEAFVLASVLQAPDWELPFEVMCDASDYAVRAVLS